MPAHSCCCTEPAATKTIWYRSATWWRRAHPSCPYAAKSWRTACRGSSDVLAKASSMRTTCGGVRMLADFVEEARAHYGIASPIALGYSNGANIAAAVLLLQPAALAGAILLRAMAPLSQTRPVDLTGKAVLIASGTNDPIISSQSAARLASALQRYGANVEHRTLPGGHKLSQADVALARAWFQVHAR